MKKRILALLLAFCLLLSGCASLLERPYTVVEPHTEQPAVGEDPSTLRVESYSELVGAVLYLVSQCQEEGRVQLVDYDGDVEDALNRACLEVAREDPLGAYAVDFIKNDYTRILTTYEANIYISYRRTPEQIRALVNVTGASAIRREMGEALSAFQGELALRVAYFVGDAASIAELVHQAYYDTPAAALGMQIVGYDPFLSVQHALNLTPGVKVVSTLEELYGQADYISLHLPMTPETKGTLNDAAFAAMKDGVRIVNLARGELVDTEALKAALASGKCAAYVTDFPNSETAAMEGVVAIPHLGASTPESEDNCAMMAARQVRDYLDNGNIVNSVNLPVLSMAWAAKNRVCVLTKGADAAAIAAAVPAVASASKTRGEYGYFLLDTDAQVDTAAIAALPGVLRVRVLHQ